MGTASTVNDDRAGSHIGYNRSCMVNGHHCRRRFKSYLQSTFQTMTEVTANNTGTENAQQETKWFVLRVVSGKERKVK